MATAASPMNMDELRSMIANGDQTVLERVLAVYKTTQQQSGLPGNVTVPRINTIGQVGEASTSSLSQEDVSYLTLTGIR